MQIAQIDLENVKSYRRQSVTFTEGTNAICGPNGAGKSTLLEAIGFALFDSLPCSQNQFVREGEKTATVTVHLVGEDGRAYQVVRKCGRGSQYYVYDPEIGHKLTTSKSETMDWLHEFLGVEETGNLPAVFEDAVGVPQGLLTAAFLERPGNRKNTFDPLLRVDEYKRVWDALLGPRRHLEKQIAKEEKRVAGFEAEVKALPGLQEKVAALQAGIEKDKRRQTALQAELSDVTQSKRALETIKKRLDALERAVTRATGVVNTLTARLADAQAAAGRAQAAQAVVEETQAAHRAYQAAQANLKGLEEQRQERDRLKETLQGLETALALGRQRVEGLKAELKTIEAAEAEREALCPQVGAQERLEIELAEARRAADRVADAERSLEQEQERLADLEARLSRVQAGLVERAKVEEQTGSLRTELETLDKEREALTSRVATQQAELDQLYKQAGRAAKQVTGARQSLEQEQARLADLESRLSEVQMGLVELARVEGSIAALQPELKDLGTQYDALTSQAAAHQAKLEQVQTQAAVLKASEAAECPVCGGPLTPEHRAELLAGNRTFQAELEERLVETRRQWDRVAKTRQEKDRTLGKLEQRAKELPRREERDRLSAEVDAQREAVTRRKASLTEAQAEVSSSQSRRAKVESLLNELRSRRDELDEARRHKQQALDRLEKQARGLPRLEEAAELAEEIEGWQKELVELKETARMLVGTPAEVERLATELDALGDPRRQYQRVADIAAGQSAVEEDLTATGGEIADLESQVGALQERLRAYADLDERITAEQAAMTAHKEDHQRYLVHIREAEALAERRAQAAGLSDELDTARAGCDRLTRERDQVAAGYDAGSYEELVERHSSLSRELAALTERLRLWQDQVNEGQAEIERLTGVQSELEATCAEHSELVEVKQLLDHLRGVLRDAGPMVTKALVEVISLQAARLYADVMADHTARLCWTEDYQILLATGSRERTFPQLSGGEQMAAALAVRLALLREVSDIDIAFFDEPTSNLDDQRRDNLAEQILNVKGRFSQLFVISHDDTFERDTDHIVRVAKENGISRAVDQ